MLQSGEIPGDNAGSVGVFCRQGHCDLGSIISTHMLVHNYL